MMLYNPAPHKADNSALHFLDYSSLFLTEKPDAHFLTSLAVSAAISRVKCCVHLPVLYFHGGKQLVLGHSPAPLCLS